MKTVRSSQPMRHVEKRKQVVPLEKRPPQDGGATTHLRPVKRSRRPYVTHLTGLRLDQSNIAVAARTAVPAAACPPSSALISLLPFEIVAHTQQVVLAVELPLNGAAPNPLRKPGSSVKRCSQLNSKPRA